MTYKSGDVIDPNEVAKRCRELGIRSIFTDEVPAEPPSIVPVADGLAPLGRQYGEYLARPGHRRHWSY